MLRIDYLYLDFWATSCGPCIAEFPHLKTIYDRLDKSKMEILGIVGDSQPDAVANIMDKNSVTWKHILSDDVNSINKKYGIHGYPTTFLIDPQGIIIAKDLRSDDLEKKIDELMKQ